MNEYAQAIVDARADLAQAASDFFPDTCTVLRRTLADDGRSGKQETYQEHATLPCRVEKVSAGPDRVQAAKLQSEGYLNVTCVADSDLLETDRLKLYGKTYSIVGPVDSLASELFL